MTPATYWIVRNDNRESLPDGAAARVVSGCWGGWVSLDQASHIGSRREAEALAAEHGGHVVEITVTERPVGLQWVPRHQFPDHEAGLLDGKEEVAAVAWDRIYDQHYWFLYDARTHANAPSFDAATAAAEAAVKEGWT